MSRYTQRRRGSLLGDPRVVTTAIGVLAVAGVVALLPQASDAASDNTQLAANSGSIVCPAVSLDGINVPASAKADVDRNVALLKTQVDEANGRLRSSAGQGGPNFVRNAILAPLQEKRLATLNRIATAIGRQGARPQGLDALAPCQQQGGGQGQNTQTGGQNGGQNGNNQNGQNGQNGNGQNGGVGAEPAPANGTNPADTSNPTDIVNPTSTQQPQGQRPADGATAPSLGILGNNCDNSRLQPHNGFQDGNRCVTTEFGEVGSAENNPSLLISSAPRFVRSNQPFDLRVTTKNLVRDRFLAAAQGGYYKESSFLTGDGLVRGHFHTACRMLNSRTNAPDQAAVPAFFAATEDGRGGRNQDTVTVRVTGLPRGEAQCAVWAGDGSHRVPMMQRANQTPAFDVVRISVR